MMSNELKACPFCGEKGALKADSQCGGMGCYTSLFYVACSNCGARGGATDSYFHGSNDTYLKLLAIDNWNRRADNEQREAD